MYFNNDDYNDYLDDYLELTPEEQALSNDNADDPLIGDNKDEN